MSFINKRNSSRDLSILIISFISSFEIVNSYYQGPNIFLWLAASVAATSVNSDGIKTFSAYSFKTFFLKGNPVFSNDPKSLPKTPPDCPILHSWVFEHFKLADESFAKALRIFETCVLVNNNLCGSYFSLTFYWRF